MMKSMRSTLLLYTCALLSVAALSACDTKSTDATSDASAPVDIAEEDGESAASAKAAAPKDEAGKPELERPSASSPNGAEVSHDPPLGIENLLTDEDLSALSAGEISSGKLAGKAATPTYNSTRFYPKDGSIYGVGLQVWKFDEDSEAAGFVTQMRAQYLGVEDAPADAPTQGERAFVSERAGIENYIFAPEDAANHVFALSCSADFCQKGWADLKPLADTVAKRAGGAKAPEATADVPKNVQEKEAPPVKAPQKEGSKDTQKAAKK